MKKTIMTLGTIGMALASTTAFAANVQDVNKTVIQQMPYQVEVCGQQHYSGDKTGDTIVGSIIGGVIGNQFGSGSGKDAMTVLGAFSGADQASQRKREKVIIRYEKHTRCHWEYQ